MQALVEMLEHKVSSVGVTDEADYPGRMIESDVVLIPSPTRRVIMKNILWEESDHHAINAEHPRQYPREEEDMGEWS